ncbi:hypothetical protein ABGB12_11490 [Actinocorallia sp. B10E7]|uniref:hypothetical protein n=1 Tax=Actinocorallia sp. B10E7 TaxID=3153558 RepID=UPI00325F8E9C
MNEEPEAAGPPALRWLGAIVANATVITALLVYFGWQRSEVMAKRLGIDESVLGMSTREYVLRSVGPVLVLLLVISVAGFGWLALDRWLTGALETPGRTTRIVLLLLSLAWLVLPLLAWLLGYVPALRAQVFIAFPFTLGAGVLLAFYASRLRADPEAPNPRDPMLKGFVTVIVAVSLFTGTSNYATVLGTRLADGVTPGSLTRVAIYSPTRLHLGAPGVVETPLPPPDPKTKQDTPFLFRYTGLRLLDHVGGQYFLISDAWTRRTSTVMPISDKSPARFEFSQR